MAIQAACGSCGAPSENLKQCAGCHNVAYCNQACQRAHWSAHKPACRQMAANNLARRLNAQEMCRIWLEALGHAESFSQDGSSVNAVKSAVLMNFNVDRLIACLNLQLNLARQSSDQEGIERLERALHLLQTEGKALLADQREVVEAIISQNPK